MLKIHSDNTFFEAGVPTAAEIILCVYYSL